MSDKVIVTVAPTSNFHGKDANPALPEQPAEIAQSVREAYDAGACLAHMHARDANGVQSTDPAIVTQINAQVRAACPVIIQNSIAPAMGANAEDAGTGMRTLDAFPEMSSIDLGYAVINLPQGEHHIGWSLSFLRKAALIMKERGIRPEMEIFNNSQLDLAATLIAEGLIEPPLSYSFVMGMNRANQSAMGWHPATLFSMVQLLPAGAKFSTLGVGPAQHPATVQSLILGGGVRVGFEDSITYRKGEPATSNAQLVERIVTIIRDLGMEPATPAEAREMLGVPQLGTPESIETRHPEYRVIREPA
ncbi:3-keto-5-aminohexanoate cleavage protein [Maritimibacter sp. DP07]|jgi:3-keto-5-aminohexanoate cleavage enzyme|uniref:3-keto-5-aminohexanoate cleavage protein n=1 Tax=Maritimibacter harenae TaxID=2606218 RepID=A0A845MAF4_9RHOB|nr:MULTISPECIES: 3-keto-5-aminohexanoate cleavage protein [Maritimibacter]MBL6430231.1 3-keto-5-aminohexanoate cleavage protein [Maritimibacter sp.]MZR13701.1 3-keto-5-aminohexanoate cleavage protein [Maritimibacter harenae]